MYGSGTTFSSRNNLPGAAGGDLLQRIDSPLFHGVGLVRVGTCRTGSRMTARLNGARVLIQDEDASTPETYNHVIVRATTSGVPDVTGPVIFRTGALTTPPGTGTMAWSLIADLATPVEPGIPLAGAWFHGVGLTPNLLWPADGASIHGASSVVGVSGDNSHPLAPNAMHTIDRSAGSLTVQPTQRTSAMFLRLEGAVLRTGQDVIAAARRGANPSYGWGGVYPYVNRPAGGDGITLHVSDAANAGGVAGWFMAVAHTPFPLPYCDANGGFWLSGPIVTAGSGSLDATGQATLVLAGQGSLPAIVGVVLYQTVTADSSFANLRITLQAGQSFL
jgi:hypothetical protein